MNDLDILLDNRNCLDFLPQVRRDKNKNYIIFINLMYNPFYVIPLTDMMGQCRELVNEKNIFIFKNLGERLEGFLLDHSEEKDVIVDIFMGDGNLGVLCKKYNRHYIGMEENDMLYKIAYKRIMENSDG